MLVELVVELLCTAHLALLLCNLGLHFGALNVPGIPGALMVVPFELEEAHDTCTTVSPLLSRERSPNTVMMVEREHGVPCRVYSVPAGALPSPPPLAPLPFMAEGDCQAMAVEIWGPVAAH